MAHVSCSTSSKDDGLQVSHSKRRAHGFLGFVGKTVHTNTTSRKERAAARSKCMGQHSIRAGRARKEMAVQEHIKDRRSRGEIHVLDHDCLYHYSCPYRRAGGKNHNM